MLNLQTVTTATTAQLRDFCKAHNVAALGDGRTYKAWFDAAYQFLKDQAVAVVKTATSEKAVAFYKSAFRFTCKTIVTLCLAAIVLGMLTREMLQMFWGWLNVQLDPTPEQSAIKILGRIVTRTVFACARIKTWFQIMSDRAVLRLQSAQSAMTWNALQVKHRAINARHALTH